MFAHASRFCGAVRARALAAQVKPPCGVGTQFVLLDGTPAEAGPRDAVLVEESPPGTGPLGLSLALVIIQVSKLTFMTSIIYYILFYSFLLGLVDYCQNVRFIPDTC